MSAHAEAQLPAAQHDDSCTSSSREKVASPQVAPWSSSFSSYFHLSEASLPQRRASACASEKRTSAVRFGDGGVRLGDGTLRLLGDVVLVFGDAEDAAVRLGDATHAGRAVGATARALTASGSWTAYTS